MSHLSPHIRPAFRMFLTQQSSEDVFKQDGDESHARHRDEQHASATRRPPPQKTLVVLSRFTIGPLFHSDPVRTQSPDIDPNLATATGIATGKA